MMQTDDLANSFLGSSDISNLWNIPRFTGVNEALGGYKKANPTLITTAWQTLLESPDLNRKLYPNAIGKTSAYPSLGTHQEKYLLCLGNNKFYLLVFDPTLTTDEPIILDGSKDNTSASINTGYSIWRSKMNNAVQYHDFLEEKYVIPPLAHAKSATSILNRSVLNTIEPSVLQYGIENTEWPIVIAKPPKKIYNCQHPAKAHKVVLKEGDAFKSLAGIYTKDTQGNFGVSICLHSFPGSYAEAGKTMVTINGLKGTVISVHNISDSCFVHLDATESQIADLLTAKGPLLGKTPREFDPCYFIDRDGTRTDTNVIGWSPDILYFDPYNQVKVLTNPITNPGDSGSALLDSDENVLGFSFYRTEINAVKEFSAWIWAASVFKAHNLNP